MPLPTLDKTWQYNVNQLIVSAAEQTHNRNLLLTLKNTLIGFGSNPWTVTRSSNSVVANTSDNWTVGTDIVGAASGVHSWIVLRNTNGQEVCIDCLDAASGAPTVMRRLAVIYSHAAGFTGGTTSARPTATDESVQFTAATGEWIPQNTTQPDQRVHVMHTTDGRCTRIFFAQGGTVYLWWHLEHIKSPAAGHALPYLYRFVLASTVTSRTTRAFVTGTTSNLSSRIGSTNIVVCGLFPGRDTTVANSILGESYTQVADETDGGHYCYEIGLVATTVSHRGPKGLLFDIWAGQTPPATTGDTYPTGGSRQFVLIGHFIHPWNGSVMLLA